MNHLQTSVGLYFEKAIQIEQTDKIKALYYYGLAYKAQKEAAEIEQNQSVKAILLLSAACLAIRLMLFKEALELAQQALQYNPPTEIAKQLKDTVEYVSKFLNPHD
jgi:tetratricopeptide (TPR) repeat protein